MGLNADILDLVQAHHDAFLVDLLGEANCGLPRPRIDELRQRGLLAGKSPLGGLPVDPLAVVIQLGSLMERYSSLALSDDVQKLMHSPLPRAISELQRLPKKSAEESHPSTHSPGAVVLHDHAAHQPHLHEPERPKPPDVTDGTPLGLPGKPPPGVPVRSYGDAVHRIGMYCRGLGNQWSDALQDWIGERWEGDVLEKVPRPGTREAVVDKIRRVVKDAWETDRSASHLAHKLAKETGDFGRNWRRIAETELQALFNETVLQQGVERWGDMARVARIPESDACEDCKRLLIDPDTGKPVIWEAEKLLANGVNVGKTKAGWKATLFPIHPRCRCGTLVIPPGATVDTSGRINLTGITFLPK